MGIVETIRDQFGGNRSATMIGARYSRSGDNCLVVSFKAKAKNKAKHVTITLEQNDTYTMRFLNFKGDTFKTISDVYAEDMKRFFQDETGLYLTL